MTTAALKKKKFVDGVACYVIGQNSDFVVSKRQPKRRDRHHFTRLNTQ